MAIDEVLRAQGYCAFIKPPAALARRPRANDVCRHKAGTGTDHPGEGCCYKHGGRAGTVTTGLYRRYSSIKNPRLRELLDAQEADPDPLDLTADIKLLRGLIEDYIGRYEEYTEALIAWHESFLAPGQAATAKPRQVVDILAAGKFIESLGSLAERTHRQRQEGAVSMAGLKKWLEEYTLAVCQAVTATVHDEDLCTKVIDEIDRRTGGLAIDTRLRAER